MLTPLAVLFLSMAVAAANGQRLKQVLDPSQFEGDAQVGYQSAQQCPEVAAKLFCYCGCDRTEKHTSLLDCFTTRHSVDCPVCVGEMVTALSMHRFNKPMAEIQKAIDDQYTKEYPYKQPTPALTSYRSHRLYKEGATGSAKGSKSLIPPAVPSQAKKRVGSCCGNESKSLK
jgi:hypothetical protein